jgi:CheY-like chemotaxis protein
LRTPGAGLKDADRHAIFDLFYQADKGLHRKGGLGLGLTLVKRLVEMQGGIVSAASAGLGKGSTFTVRLPLCEDRSQAAAIPRTGTAAASLLNILVVDDSEDARDSLQMLLGIDGHRVDVAADGAAALQALSQDGTGCSVSRHRYAWDGWLRTGSANTPLYRQRVSLIAMTGYGQPEDVRRAMDAGFDAHLIKPADLETLNAVLAKVARRPKLVVNERRA